ncbi:hypothetical protein HID58_093556 [Brassica napus]|uniref:Uncharacterized protein n=1 Tax=Brassica napus TaxID=3708 RepID=A0ABQ7XAK3_BRANA|nr:hypothetical protein HID58_093556 [Brassica napus]
MDNFGKPVRIETGGSEAPSQVVRPRRRAQRRARFDRSDRLPAPRSIPFDEVDCRPVIYHPEVRPVPTDGDVNSEPPAQSSPKKKASKAKKRSVPLEEAPSSADASEVAAKKKKKKKESKKRSREEASVEVLETSTAAGDDDAGRNDPTDSTRGSSEERPKKKSKKTTAEDDGSPAPEIPSRSGGPDTETGDGSRDESPLSRGALSPSARKKGVESGGSLPQKAGRGFPDRVEFLDDKATPLAANEKEVLRVKFAELEDKLKSDRLAKKDALREKARLEWLVASLEKEKTELEGERDAVVGTLVTEREHFRNSRIQEVTRERIRVQTAMADKSTRCFGRRVTVPEGTAVEECPDENHPEVGGIATQEGTGDVAAEDPVLGSSSEEREDDEGGDQEENRSSPALIEETALNPSAPDPPAQVEGLKTHVAEGTMESLDLVVSNKYDQDAVA